MLASESFVSEPPTRDSLAEILEETELSENECRRQPLSTCNHHHHHHQHKHKHNIIIIVVIIIIIITIINIIISIITFLIKVDGVVFMLRLSSRVPSNLMDDVSQPSQGGYWSR